MVRISATELVRRDKVQFDVDAVDDALEKMYPNEYTALKDITLFLSLPAASVRWNGYVLESYLRDYSKKFRLVQVSDSHKSVVCDSSFICSFSESTMTA